MDPNAKKHPVTGCRADTIFGMYLCPEARLENWRDAAWNVFDSGQLEQFAERSRVMQQQEAEEAEQNGGKLYKVDENHVAHIHMSGPMSKHPTSFQSLFGGVSTMRVREALKQIRMDSMVKAVMLHADSWGGTAEGTAELAASIRKTNAVKPVLVHAEDKATSAMLWCATQGARLTCGPTASIGSLGTIMKLEDRSELNKDKKVKPVIIKTGDLKDLGSSDRPITDQDRAELQRYVNAINKPFKAEVQAGRKLDEPKMTEIATARVFVGGEAKEVGLVDEICTTDQAYDYLLNNVIPEAAVRGPAPGALPSAASKRSTAMEKFTPEQLQQARTLPGAAQATEENANVVVLTSALELLKQNQTLAANQAPRIPEDAILLDRARNAVDRVDILLQKEQILPAQAALLKDLFMKDEKPSLHNKHLLLEQNGQYVYQPLLKVFEQNKPNGLVPEQTGAQPATRTEPGTAKTDQQKTMEEARQEGEKYEKELLAGRGNGQAA